MSIRAERIPPDQVSLAPLLAGPGSGYRWLLRQPRVPLAPSPDRVTLDEAADILGYDAEAARRLVTTGRTRHGVIAPEDPLLRTTVEDLATEVYSWRMHLDDPSPYWLTGQRAARILRISRGRLGQLAAENRVPFVRHQDGTRLYRRWQLEQLAGSTRRVRRSG